MSSADRAPIALAAYAAIFTAVHFYLNLTGGYIAHPWVDWPMHIGGGVWVAWALVHFGGRVEALRAVPRPLLALGYLGGVALVGAGWEILEGIVDAHIIWQLGMTLEEGFGVPPFDRRLDMVIDLWNDLLGGAAVLVAWLLLSRGGRG